MLQKIRQLLRSFKSKILLSFFAFIRIFLIWICVYFVINHKQARLDLFTHHLTQLQFHYAESNRYLQRFILSGFHDSGFYAKGVQPDMTLFLARQDSVTQKLNEIKAEALSNDIDIKDELNNLSSLQKSLLDSVTKLKQLYLNKGFKYFGAEGRMHYFAHYLEDSSPIRKEDVLMLRRREKDFMLRGDQKYITDFNTVVDAQINKFAHIPATLDALTNYKKHFNIFASYSRQIDLNGTEGTYGHVQTLINQVDDHLININAKVIRAVSGLRNFFQSILIATFAFLLLVAVYLTVVLSRRLTKDIKTLNKNIAGFVNSGFKEIHIETLQSDITEIQALNSDFVTLKNTLRQTLTDLEHLVEEERKLSAEHEATIAALKHKIMDLERQKDS